MLQEKKNSIYTGSTGRQSLYDVFWDDEYEKAPVVLFCHGYKGYKDWGAWDLVAREFAKEGFVFVKFNFSLNGGTLEEPIDFPDLEAFSQNNYTTELEDVKRMIGICSSDEFRSLTSANTNKLFLIGHSRGGAIALLAARENPEVSKLVTWAAVGDLGMRFSDEKALEQWKKEGVVYVENTRTGQMMPHRYQFYEDFMANEERLDVLSHAARLTIPVMIAHGDADESVPVEHAIQLSAANPQAELVILDDADHSFGARQPYSGTSLPEHLSELCRYTRSFLFGEL